MKKKNVLILGASGMLGHMIADYLFKKKKTSLSISLKDTGLVQSFRRKYKGANVFYFDAQTKRIEDLNFNSYDYIINCIGIIKPLINEKDQRTIAKSVYLNSYFPHLLAGKRGNAKIIQIATDCVFSGKKGNYIENDLHDAFDIYGKTKSLGEVNLDKFINIRCSIIGPELIKKGSLFEWFLSQEDNAKIDGFTNHLWNGITTLHFAKLCEVIIKDDNKNLPNLFHFIPSDKATKYELLNLFRKYFRKKANVVPVNAKISVDRTLSTNYARLNKDLWKRMGYKTPPTIEIMVQELSEYEKI